jgi:hypothetical protein
MSIQPGTRQPYNYAEHGYVTASTTNQFYTFKRYPDQIILYNTDPTDNIYVKFGEAAETTSGYIIPAGTERRFYLKISKLGIIASAGTPKLLIVGLAYRDERVTA